jgi:hypothetical protein
MTQVYQAILLIGVGVICGFSLGLVCSRVQKNRALEERDALIDAINGLPLARVASSLDSLSSVINGCVRSVVSLKQY